MISEQSRTKLCDITLFPCKRKKKRLWMALSSTTLLLFVKWHTEAVLDPGCNSIDLKGFFLYHMDSIREMKNGQV